MKKIVSLILCVLLLAAAAVTVQAEEVPKLTIRAGNSAPQPGDTVEFTVSVDPIEDCRSGGIVLSYDDDVFEFVSGQCLISDAFMADFTDGTGVFAFAEGKTVSGNVFRYTLRVKADAAYGDHTVSCKTNFRTDAGSVTMRVIGAGISLNCEHTYGSWIVADALAHQRDCSKCGKQEMHSHTWDEGRVTKQPSCKEEGRLLQTCTACGTTQTQILEKTDNHTYGGCVKVDENTHKRSCTLCGKENTASHTWDSGKATKQPNCKETGVKAYTCTGCGATKTEALQKTEDHRYGGFTSAGDSGHKQSCTVCGKENTANHTWDSGKVTKQPNCKEVGVKTYTCTGCGATKTDTLQKTEDHRYGSFASAGDTAHKQSCTVCGKENTANHTWDGGKITQQPDCKAEGVKTYTCSGCGTARTEVLSKTETHIYDHNCDTVCNVCGLERKTEHTYKSGWVSNRDGHYHACSVCGDKKDSAAHTPGKAATETTAQRCTVCGYVLQAALGHKHSFAEELTYDEQGHWYPCDGCNEQQRAEHDFENSCDTLCESCGYTREIVHDYAGWEHDSRGHWQVCEICGELTVEEEHIPGEEATEQTAQTCTECGYELAPKLVPVHQEETSEDAERNVEVQQPDNSLFWIVALALMVAGGVIVATVVLRKVRRT